MENIGIIGTGNMGRALGTRFAQAGHTVFFGARDLNVAHAAAADAGHESQGGSIADAVRSSSLLLWTMREPDPAKVVPDVSLLDGKILMDLNNRDYAVEARNGAWFESAIAERLQNNAPNAEVVKVFNTLAMEAFDIDPSALRSAGATTFLAGRSQSAKTRVANVAESIGLAAVDLGNTATAVRAAEALGDVIRLLMIDGSRGARAHLKVIELPDAFTGSIGKRQPSKYA